MGDVMGGEVQFPSWLQPFLLGDYFSRCINHSNRKNERNHFCIECIEGPLCHIGLQNDHAGHSTLQVRRASHMDAVRVHDVQELADVSSIQTYSINGAKILFLLCRPQYRVLKGASYSCITCGRTLWDPVAFCSISCKLSLVASRKNIAFSLSLSEEDNTRKCSDSDIVCDVMPNLESRREHYSLDHQRIYEAFTVDQRKLSQEQWITSQSQKPLKKRRYDFWANTSTFTIESSDGLCQIDSPISPISVLHSSSLKEVYEANDLQYKLYPCTQEPVLSLPAVANVRELNGFRRRHRKGQPRRSPLT